MLDYSFHLLAISYDHAGMMEALQHPQYLALLRYSPSLQLVSLEPGQFLDRAYLLVE
jgi:hypothetical protein